VCISSVILTYSFSQWRDSFLWKIFQNAIQTATLVSMQITPPEYTTHKIFGTVLSKNVKYFWVRWSIRYCYQTIPIFKMCGQIFPFVVQYGISWQYARRLSSCSVRTHRRNDMAMLMAIRMATNAPKQYHNCNRHSSQSGAIERDAVATLSSTLAMP
jgi:hypothetical protein